MTPRLFGRLFIVGFAVMVVQIFVLQQVDIGGAHPDAFLCLAVAAGLMGGAQQGAVVGFLVGILADLFVPTPFGLQALCLTIVAYGVGLVSAMQGDRAPSAFRAAAGFVAGVGGTLVYDFLLILVDQPHLPAGTLGTVILVVAVSNAVGVVPLSRAMGYVFSASARRGSDLTVAGGQLR